MKILNYISQELQKGNVENVKSGILQAIEENIEPEMIMYSGLADGMESVASKFKKDEISIPEILIITMAMDAGLDILKPKLIDQETKPLGKVLLGSVKGDIHDIGRRLVGVMLEGSGFEVYDIGSNVSAEEFVKKIKEIKPDIVGLSVLISTVMVEMKKIIDAIEEEGLRKDVKIIVGGSCVTKKFAEKIGADAYGKDAPDAVLISKKIVLN